jgi:hypothetical protein
MRRIIFAVGLSLALVMTLATMASAGPGKSNAYGLKIKAYTGLTFGQLMQAVKAGETAYPELFGDLRQGWGPKRVWTNIEKDVVDADDDEPGLGYGFAYGKRIKECTGLSYGQLRSAAMLGTLDPKYTTISEGVGPAKGAKWMWEQIVATKLACQTAVTS